MVHHYLMLPMILIMRHALDAAALDRMTDWIGRQEAQDGCAGHATKDDRQDSPHTGDGPVDGGAAVCSQDGAPRHALRLDPSWEP
jgi:hypothetical protein